MSNSVVVDTDVVSYLFKSHPTALQYLPDLTDRTPMISFMTLAELDRSVRQVQACGRRIDCADAWIAATALIAGAPLITHNRNDYLGVPGLTLISRG
jgi:predicted nucleic acid-binding protein